jgi:hypothetical protein
MDKSLPKGAPPIYVLPSSSDDSEPELHTKRAASIAPVHVVPSSSSSSPEASVSFMGIVGDLPLPKEFVCEQLHQKSLDAVKTISSSTLDSSKNKPAENFISIENPPPTLKTKKGSTLELTAPGMSLCAI